MARTERQTTALQALEDAVAEWHAAEVAAGVVEAGSYVSAWVLQVGTTQLGSTDALSGEDDDARGDRVDVQWPDHVGWPAALGLMVQARKQVQHQLIHG